MVDRIARRFGAARVGVALPRPPVVVPVAAFDLVGRSGRAPHEPFGKRRHGRVRYSALAGLVLASLAFAPARADAAIAMRAKKVATLTQPIAFAARSGDAAKVVYIAQQN